MPHFGSLWIVAGDRAGLEWCEGCELLEWVIRLRNRVDRPRNVGVCFVGTGVRTQYGPFSGYYEDMFRLDV